MSIKVLLNDKVEDFINEYSEFKNQAVNKKFLFFVIFQLTKDSRIEYEDIVDGITDAPYDCGIDAAYLYSAGDLIREDEPLESQISKEGKIKIQLIQVTRDEGFSETVLLKLKNAVEDIFEIGKEMKGANECLLKKVELIRNVWRHCFNHRIVDQIEIELIYATLSNTRPNYKVLEIESKIRTFLNSQSLNKAKICYFGIPELYNILSEDSYEKELIFKDLTQYAESYNRNLVGYYGLVRLKDLLTFISNPDGEIIEKYFEGNVRDFYGLSKKVNVKIKETIENTEKRVNFWCLNNGVTIICNKANLLGKKLNISNFYIVNGCQTAHVLHSLKEILFQDDQSEILVKVIQTENEEVSNEIIEATNSQTAVSPVSLHSNDLIQKNIEDYFLRNDFIIYYERRMNYYRLRYKPRNKIISIIKLFQIFYSVYYKKPSAARGRPADSFNSNYEKVFNTSYDYDSYLLGFLLYFKLNCINRDKIKQASGKFLPLVVKYGQFHIARIAFALAIQDDSVINFYDKNNKFELNKKLLFKIINDDSKLNSLYQTSVEIIKRIIRHMYETNNNLMLSYNLFKNDELDRDIKKELAKRFIKKHSLKNKFADLPLAPAQVQS